MAILQTTPPISFTNIKTVFSGSNNFSDYIRGGLYVPNITINNAISLTAIGLALSQFYGTGIPPTPTPTPSPTPVTTPLSVSANPTAVSGSANTASTVTVATTSTTVTATGGTGTGYTYVWTYVSGAGPLNMTLSGNIVAYWYGAVSYLSSFQNIYKCTVTDSGGNTGSVNVTATISNG